MTKEKMKFTRQDQHKKKRLNKGWRRPKGLQNKMRLSRKSYKLKVRPGYGTENSKKNTFNGKEIVLVYSINDLQKLTPKKHALSIAKISAKNKLELITQAKKQGFEFVNFNPEKYEKAVQEKLKQRKEEKKAKQEKEKAKKAKKKEDKPAKSEEKADESEKEESAEEENKDKKEKDKVLTKSK